MTSLFWHDLREEIAADPAAGDIYATELRRFMNAQAIEFFDRNLQAVRVPFDPSSFARHDSALNVTQAVDGVEAGDTVLVVADNEDGTESTCYADVIERTEKLLYLKVMWGTYREVACASDHRGYVEVLR